MLLNNVVAFVATGNVALMSTAFQSSTYSSAAATRAVDGDLNTVSCTQMATTTPWWAADLGTAMDIERVYVTNDLNAYYGQLFVNCFAEVYLSVVCSQLSLFVRVNCLKVCEFCIKTVVIGSCQYLWTKLDKLKCVSSLNAGVIATVKVWS